MQNQMSSSARAVAEDCVRDSDESRMPFPEVVQRLNAVGVERYNADLCRAEKIFYMSDGASHAVPCARLDKAPSRDFSAEGIAAALRAIQTKTITYHDFCAQIAAAGCVSYLVTLSGRCAIYSGRNGESFVERFPPGL